ncbi:ROK family protein [Microbacterium protaetiae]|uniref:ROK family protein n=1 Tax=Microbacterium protaetiae TaxID=2509458 RepID=A0A4P6E9Y3_9MICO|nr:ROK family protein [Microbacterium protaetiae]QAY58940.1 ROK family protein [Microbacterium protaetiae]
MRVGLDVGGTKTDAVAVDAAGTITGRVRLATGWGPDGVVQTVVDAVEALVAAGVERGGIQSVGVGMPGQVHPGSSHVLHAVNLGIADLDLAAATAPRLGVPVSVENDVKAAALGADALRGGAGGTMAFLNLGTGVAAGIVSDGTLWTGAHGTAGEVGHIAVDPHGPICTCGQRGCVEALSGGAAIARRWGRPAPLPVLDMLDAADRADPHAQALRADLMIGVSAAVRILVLTADVDVVVIGGGLSGLGDRLMDGVRAELEASAAASEFMRSLHLPGRVQLLPAGSPAAALGAALVGAARERDTRETVFHG